MSRKISRRELLKGLGVTALAASLYACQPKETAQPAAEQPTEAPKEEAKQPVEEQVIDMSIAVWLSADRPWPREKSLEWNDLHPEVNLKLNDVNYDDSQKHQLTGHATGTLEDLVFGGVKLNVYSAYKGVFLDLGPLVDKFDCDFDDFIPAAIEGCTLDGMLFAFPYETNTGNENIFYYNKTMLQEKGIEEPTDDWTWDEFVDFFAKNLSFDLKRDRERLQKTGFKYYDLLLAQPGRVRIKLIARDLGISHRTVEAHRARLMMKSGAASVADLIRLALRDAEDQPVAGCRLLDRPETAAIEIGDPDLDEETSLNADLSLSWAGRKSWASA